MSRWREAYAASNALRNKADSADTTQPGQEMRADCVSTVSTVTGLHTPNDDSEAIERAAIVAEAEPVRRLRKRMTSWAEASDEPAQGDFCGACGGHLWWIEAQTPKGWRCACCHPPAHLQAGQFNVRAT